MVDQQYRLLSTLDRWIEQLERAHEDRTAAGIKAGEAVRAQADQTLLASIGKPPAKPRDRRPTPTTPRYAACRLVAAPPGSPSPSPPQSGADERPARPGRARSRSPRGSAPAPSGWTAAGGARTSGRWSATGPLSGAPVALLWRRGGYEAVQPGDRAGETPVEQANAEEFEPRAVMFYRPLPERPLSPLAAAALQPARHRAATCANLLLGGLVTVALGALVPIATGQVLGEYVPKAETSLIVQVCAGGDGRRASSSAAFMLLQNLTMLRMEGRIEATLQPAVWDRLLRLPTTFFTERSTGELASAAMGISAIRRVLSGIGPVVAPVGHGRRDEPRCCCSGTASRWRWRRSACWWSSPPCSSASGLWQVRWQRRLVELEQQAQQPGVPDPARTAQAAGRRGRELRVRGLGGASSPAAASCSSGSGRIKNLTHGARRGLSAAVLAADVHAAGGPGAGLACRRAAS